MSRRLQITTNVAKVLSALLADVDGEHYGFALMRATGLPSGGLYPILARLEAAEVIAGHKEILDPTAKRPARRYYKITPDGVVYARQALAELHAATSYHPVTGFGQPAGSPA